MFEGMARDEPRGARRAGDVGHIALLGPCHVFHLGADECCWGNGEPPMETMEKTPLTKWDPPIENPMRSDVMNGHGTKVDDKKWDLVEIMRKPRT